MTTIHKFSVEVFTLNNFEEVKANEDDAHNLFIRFRINDCDNIYFSSFDYFSTILSKFEDIANNKYATLSGNEFTLRFTEDKITLSVYSRNDDDQTFNCHLTFDKNKIVNQKFQEFVNSYK